MEKSTITKLNNALDGFVKMFDELSIEERTDFIHLNSFLDSIYSEGWDDSHSFYCGSEEEGADEETEIISEQKYDCSKCVISDWCEKRDVKPLVIGGECMKYWERKTNKVRGIDWYNMNPDERKNHPVWKEMKPSERLAAISIESSPDRSFITRYKLLNSIIETAEAKYPDLSELGYFLGYEQGITTALRYFSNSVIMEVLKRILDGYRDKED